jgi:hypothetical protein
MVTVVQAILGGQRNQLFLWPPNSLFPGFITPIRLLSDSHQLLCAPLHGILGQQKSLPSIIFSGGWKHICFCYHICSPSPLVLSNALCNHGPYRIPLALAPTLNSRDYIIAQYSIDIFFICCPFTYGHCSASNIRRGKEPVIFWTTQQLIPWIYNTHSFTVRFPPIALCTTTWHIRTTEIFYPFFV